MKDKRRILKIALIGAAVLLGVVLLYVGAMWVEKLLEEPVPVDPGAPVTHPTYSDNEWEIAYYNGGEYRFNDRLSALLLIGVDDEQLEVDHAFRNTGQSDFLVLAVFDPSQKRYTLLQINRDTMAHIPQPSLAGGEGSYRYEQMALAHTYGGGGRDSCENTVKAVSHFLYDIPIDNYYAVTIDAIPVLNDLLGGVPVTIEDDFTGVDDTLVKGETVTLMGEHAVNYVRARSGMTEDDTNLARMRRQRTYMASLAQVLKDAVNRDGEIVSRIYEALDPSMVTDCMFDQLLEYTDSFASYTSNGIVTPKGEAKVGEQFMEFYVDEESLQEQVIRLFYLPVEEESQT